MKRIRFLAPLLAALLLTGACGKTGGGSDSETHWLALCTSDAACGSEGTCSCGVCTLVCNPDASCADGPSGSRCVAGQASLLCSGANVPVGLCVKPCSLDDDCSAGLGCVAGACVERPSALELENPTGTCSAPDDGARPGYHSPGHDWLPDCKNPLKREYYRVFGTTHTTAYIIPRPDGAPQLAAACADPTSPIADILQKYPLCEQAPTEQAVDRLNAMNPADALRLTHFLHTQLVFEAHEKSGITPFAIPSDVLDACALAGTMSAELGTICENERRYVDSGVDIGRTYSGSGGLELAQRLDALYGITCQSGSALQTACLACGPAGGCAEHAFLCSRACASSDECVGAPVGEFCSDGQCGIGPCF